ncbi:hypothetical protein IZ181_01325 [Morganella morganii subsp. morganii]|nr:hypothetical protein [Morganella morganii]QWM16894.1 hypothetical protein IZ181_01325 [Morganella morganii subsp. morganii]
MCIHLNLMIFTKIIRGFISAWQAFFDNNGYDVQTGFGGDLEKDLKNNQKNNLLNTSSYMVIYDEKP